MNVAPGLELTGALHVGEAANNERHRSSTGEE